MRTTITLDKEVAVVIERLRRTRNQTLKAVITEALPERLKRIAARPAKWPIARTRSVAPGRCLLGTGDDVAEHLAFAERDAFT